MRRLELLIAEVAKNGCGGRGERLDEGRLDVGAAGEDARRYESRDGGATLLEAVGYREDEGTVIRCTYTL